MPNLRSWCETQAYTAYAEVVSVRRRTGLFTSGRLLPAGVAIGLVASLAGSSILKTMLYGVTGRDPVVLTAVCLVGLTGLLSAYLPAWRAAAIEPLTALRSE